MMQHPKNDFKAAVKKWLNHKRIIFEKGHGYEEKKKVYEYVRLHLEMTDYSGKMIQVMKDKLKQLLPHEANPTYQHQKEILEQLLNQAG